MARMTFYYGQLGFNHQITSESDSYDVGGVAKTRSTIEQYIETNDPVFEESDSQWYFGGVTEVDGILFGQFGKEYDYERSAYQEGEFVATGENAVDASFSWFIFDPEIRIIIFNSRNRIGYNQFRNAFVGGYNKRAEELANVRNAMTMSWLTPAGELRRILETARVTTAKFTVRPQDTGRENSNRYAVLNQMLNDSKADRGTLEIKESSSEGINTDEETIQKLAELVEDDNSGFHARIEYIESGNEQIFNTRVSPETNRVSSPNNRDQLLAISDELLSRARSILS